jgi:small subunit ribosomal protein S8e
MKWHGDLGKRKASGGKKKAYRGKKAFEKGGEAAETRFGGMRRVEKRVQGGNKKSRLLSVDYANLTDPKTGKTEKVPIARVIRNRASVDYDRRGIMTKGAIIETKLGEAIVTSRPGQDGVLNVVLSGEKKFQG